MPARIQRQRTAGWRAPLDAQGRRPVYVGRGSRFGNPWRVVRDRHGIHVLAPTGGVCATVGSMVEGRAVATTEYDRWIRHPEQASLLASARETLAGRNLMCWCAVPELGEPDHCHGAPLLRLAAGEAP